MKKGRAITLVVGKTKQDLCHLKSTQFELHEQTKAEGKNAHWHSVFFFLVYLFKGMLQAIADFMAERTLTATSPMNIEQ